MREGHSEEEVVSIGHGEVVREEGIGTFQTQGEMNVGFEEERRKPRGKWHV